MAKKTLKKAKKIQPTKPLMSACWNRLRRVRFLRQGEPTAGAL
jgi:hypothetical protein